MGDADSGTEAFPSATYRWERRFSPHVARAFEQDNPEFADAFLSELRSNWRDALARARRLVFLVVLLVALFILLAGAGISEVAFAGVKLAPSSIDAIAVGIPALIAFFFARYWELYALMDQYAGVHAEIYRQIHPTLGSLERVLHPPEPGHPSSFDAVVLGRGSSGPGAAALAVTSMINGLTILFAPMGVVVLYVLLLTLDFKVNPVLYAISALIAAFSLIRVIGLVRARAHTRTYKDH